MDMTPAIIWRGSIACPGSESVGGTDPFYVKDVVLTTVTLQAVSGAVGHHSVMLEHVYPDLSSSYIQLVEFLALENEIIHLDRYFAAGDTLSIQHSGQLTYADPLSVHVTGAI
jgi:hypothetical protein